MVQYLHNQSSQAILGCRPSSINNLSKWRETSS